MKKLLSSTAVVVALGMSAAHADEVIILQNFDLARETQSVNNRIQALQDITGSSLSGTNIQNLLQWRDVSAEGDLYGDIYEFNQVTDEEQFVLNVATSRYGDVGAVLEATNLMNVVSLEDTLGGSEEVGDHILIKQVVTDAFQGGLNRIEADNDLLAGSVASISNLANVTNVVGAGGGIEAGDIVRVTQRADELVQRANNSANVGGVTGVDMSATNGVNIASFDLADMTGNADIVLDQKTHDVTQTIRNSIGAGGPVANAALSGVNLGNVVTFATADGN